jgi:predicted HTH domain antitoxin
VRIAMVSDAYNVIMYSESTAQTARRAVTLELPEELLAMLTSSADTDAAVRLSELAVIELFREGQLSTGQAARMLGLTNAAFIDLLGRHEVPYLDDTEDELRRQVEASARYRQQRP